MVLHASVVICQSGLWTTLQLQRFSDDVIYTHMCSCKSSFYHEPNEGTGRRLKWKLTCFLLFGGFFGHFSLPFLPQQSRFVIEVFCFLTGTSSIPSCLCDLKADSESTRLFKICRAQQVCAHNILLFHFSPSNPVCTPFSSGGLLTCAFTIFSRNTHWRVNIYVCDVNGSNWG